MTFTGIILTVLIVVGLIYLYFIYITTPKRAPQTKNNRNSEIDLLTVTAKWSEVEAMMKTGGPANYKQSIMEGDKIVDMALKAKVPGETMGERLKNSKNLFTPDTYNNLWTAHKIRNKLAHEADFEGLSSQASLAVRNFKEALKELKAI